MFDYMKITFCLRWLTSGPSARAAALASVEVEFTESSLDNLLEASLRAGEPERPPRSLTKVCSRKFMT